MKFADTKIYKRHKVCFVAKEKENIMEINRIIDDTFDKGEKPKHEFFIFGTSNSFHEIGIVIGFGDKKKLWKPFIMIKLFFWEIQFGWFY